jgi:hypothetical protein
LNEGEDFISLFHPVFEADFNELAAKTRVEEEIANNLTRFVKISKTS